MPALVVLVQSVSFDSLAITSATDTDCIAASADRRPVDPPPIVELKIFELKPDNSKEDITFIMNANYFLFATLEPARHIAQARGMPDQNRPTVLTGTPVAGMVYLDRPAPAGYFIFPDLSVRHEGQFRLSFSLYEELKRVEDGDKSEDSGSAQQSHEASVTHRLEVKSEVMQVYSAKKFPGLTESTALSRTVAEQGCRVRIRRDVRMRRRDGKGDKWDDYEDQTADQREHNGHKPEAAGYGYPPQIDRPRSASNTSHQSLAISRRPSLQEMTQQGYHPQPQYAGTAPHTPQNGFAPAPGYGPSPTQQYSQPPYMQQQPQQQQHAMQPPPPQYPPPSYQPAPTMAPAPATQPQHSYFGYAPAPAPQPTQYAAPQYEAPSHTHRPSGEWSSQMPQEHRRASAYQAPTTQPQPMYASQPTQQAYNPQVYQQPPGPAYASQQPPQSHYYAPVEQSVSRPPPPEPVQPPTRATAPTPPLPAKASFASNTLPPLSNALPPPQSNLEPSSPAVAMQANSNSFFANSSLPQQTPIDSHKRSYASTFPTSSYDQAQKSGARPADPYSSQGNMLFTDADTADDDVDFRLNMAQYKRADGTPVYRKYPIS